MPRSYEIKVFKLKNGRYVVFHPSSCTISLVNGKMGKILSLYEATRSITAIASESGVKEEECRRIINKFYEKVIKPRLTSQGNPLHFNNKVLYLHLIVATDCNMRCEYCYAKQGSYGMRRMLMTKETAKKAIDTFLELHPEITAVKFFGGEPLLNFKVIEWVCKYIREKLGRNLYYTISTNGTILNDRIISLLKKYRFSLTVSLDGPKGCHDSCRKFPNGQGTHRTVVRNLEKLKRAGVFLSLIHI